MEVRQAMIQVEHLVKRYGDLTAVDGVGFTIYAGEVFGLLGPNGAGKTTTMEMMEGLRRPTEGTAMIDNFDIRKQLKKVKQIIGVQLQSTSLFDLLKVHEIIDLYASFYDRTVSVDTLLEDMLLSEKKQSRVKNLSGGQKQRLAIGLALVNDPQVLFLDEPTTGLDPQARRTLWDIIIRLKERGKTIILSTHYMDEAHILCDRICLMDQGKVRALDSPQSLIKTLNSDTAIQFRISEETGWSGHKDELEPLLAAIDKVKEVRCRQDHYVLFTDDPQSTLISFIDAAKQHQISYSDLQTRTATLEDVFIHLTGRSLREE